MLCCVMLCYVMLCCVALYCVTFCPCCTVLCCVALYCTVLCYVALRCTVCCHVVLFRIYYILSYLVHIPLISRVRGPYGKLWTEFFPSFYGPSAKRAGHENKEGKNEDP